MVAFAKCHQLHGNRKKICWILPEARNELMLEFSHATVDSFITSLHLHDLK